MSDSVKKKWRLLKKNRFADLSEQNLRSRSDNNAKDKEEEEEITSSNKNSNDLYLENDERITPEKSLNHSLDGQVSSSPDSSDENLTDGFNQRYSTSPRSPTDQKNTTNGSIKRYDCDKCNLVMTFYLSISN